MKPRIRGNRPPNRHTRRLAWNRPSIYIRDIEEIKPGTPVWLWCRVSKGQQNATGNNADQEVELRAAVEARRGVVVGMTTRIGGACKDETEAALYKAATCAARAGAVLLAESTSRFTRHPDYNPKDPKPRMPGADELRTLRFICGDVPLVTMLDPDATSGEERGHQSKRGQRLKGNKGGRPAKPEPGYKKRRQHQALPKVRWMKWVGMSNRAIAKVLGIAESTVRSWVRSFLGHRDAGTRD